MGTTASCAPGIKWKMAKPSVAPVADSCAEPTCTGGVCGPAVATISEALPEMAWLSAEVGVDCEAVCCGNTTGSVSGPFPLASAGSPKKLNCACAVDDPLLTSVNVVVQFSSAARCGIEPIRLG